MPLIKEGIIIYTTVVFDLDGTLLDTIDELAEAGNHTLRILGLLPHSPEKYKQMVGHGIERLVENFLPPNFRGPATHELAVQLFQDYYSSHLNSSKKSYAGIEQLLENLSVRNIKLAVLSNKKHSLACKIIEQAFPDRFDFVQGLSKDFPKKPNPASLLHILDTLGADISRTLYCGDSGVDMQTAKSAKVSACGVLWGYREKADLVENGADFTVSTTQEIEDIVLSPALLPHTPATQAPKLQ